MIDFGAIFAKRITAFPILKREPKRETECWAVCPEFTIQPEGAIEGLEYRYPVYLFAASLPVLRDMIDMAIAAGAQEIEFEKKEMAGGIPIIGDKVCWALWLHATPHEEPARVKGKNLWGTKIVFVYRAKTLRFASEPEKTGSIAKITKISEEILSNPPEEKSIEEIK